MGAIRVGPGFIFCCLRMFRQRRNVKIFNSKYLYIVGMGALEITFGCLRAGYVKMLHRDAPRMLRLPKTRNERFPSRSGREQLPNEFGLAYGG